MKIYYNNNEVIIVNKKRIIIYTILFAITLAIATLGFTRFDNRGLIIPMAITFGYFTMIFIVAQIIKNNSIVDLGWGLGFVIGAWTTLLTRNDPTILSYLIAGFITLWGLRLSIRLTRRNWGKPEDFRYANWRKEWGKNVVIISFFRVFMIQAIINFVVGSAAYATIKFNQFDFSGFEQVLIYIGLLIALIGLFFEVVGDEQLRRHIKKGSRTLMTSGLWKITRHPNYFGETLIWKGLWLSGAGLLTMDSFRIFYIVLIVSPIIMELVLVKISTPLLEKNMEKYEGWQAYASITPMIYPWRKPK